jgi:peptide-methionine (S)-S-oxide reductase
VVEGVRGRDRQVDAALGDEVRPEHPGTANLQKLDPDIPPARHGHVISLCTEEETPGRVAVFTPSCWTQKEAHVTTETAILAGGCFWGAQELLRKRPGVLSTRVGYSGGDTPNATYRNHGDHAEAVEIVFDPEKISFRELLEFFFQIHDPSTTNRQGNDVGRSYRSAIFFTSDEQRRVALDTIADVDASGLWPGKVVTEVTPAGPFWEAEEEHQDYLQKIPFGYTCHYVRPGWVLPRREAQATR